MWFTKKNAGGFLGAIPTSKDLLDTKISQFTVSPSYPTLAPAPCLLHLGASKSEEWGEGKGIMYASCLLMTLHVNTITNCSILIPLNTKNKICMYKSWDQHVKFTSMSPCHRFAIGKKTNKETLSNSSCFPFTNQIQQAFCLQRWHNTFQDSSFLVSELSTLESPHPTDPNSRWWCGMLHLAPRASRFVPLLGSKRVNPRGVFRFFGRTRTQNRAFLLCKRWGYLNKNQGLSKNIVRELWEVLKANLHRNTFCWTCGFFFGEMI